MPSRINVKWQSRAWILEPCARGFIWFILLLRGDISGLVSAMDQVPALLSSSVHGEGPRDLVLLSLHVLGRDGGSELEELLFWRSPAQSLAERAGTAQRPQPRAVL